jgi:hypothetical protein
MSSGALDRSLASWWDAHGFGILCIVSPLGEHFAVHPSADAAAFTADPSRVESWTHLPAVQVKDWMVQHGLPSAEADDGIRLAREWATTITGGGALAVPIART